MNYYNLKKIPFLRVRVVLDSKENPLDITLKRARLYNLKTKQIGATSIWVEKDGGCDMKETEPAVVSTLDHFCGQYRLAWSTEGEAEEEQQFTIVLSESKMNSEEMAKKVFAFEDDVRKYEKTQSLYFEAKRTANYSLGKQAEEAAERAAKYKKEMDELHEMLKKEGIIRENFMYVPAYMYIFPKRKMEDGYYRRATFFRIRWLTPNVCIIQSSSFFRKYCEMSKAGK